MAGMTPEAQVDFYLGVADMLLDVPAAFCGDDVLMAQAHRQKLQQVRAELGEATAPPLERLLIERIALCWWDCTIVECGYRRALRDPEGLTYESGEYYDGKRDRAHKRYLSAIKALAEVRKLKLPDVTLQAIGQQVNIGGVAGSRVSETR